MNMTGAQILMEGLVREGVERIFGYAGATICPAVAMEMVKAPEWRMLAVVLCPALMQTETSRVSLMPPQAAFMQFGVPSGP